MGKTLMIRSGSHDFPTCKKIYVDSWEEKTQM